MPRFSRQPPHLSNLRNENLPFILPQPVSRANQHNLEGESISSDSSSNTILGLPEQRVAPNVYTPYKPRSLDRTSIANHTIHGDIKAAYRHAREINRLLAKIRFSDSIYQIEILPAENENGQFYEMLTAKELDSKVTDDLGFEGQMSLGDDDFYRKYEQKIQLLTEKFMPPAADQDPRQTARQKQEMERYADYRSYLTFRMYERVEDEHGVVKKNPVDEMAGRDSGGEGQNPKYVALLAGFAMLYMQQSSRDSKIRLVLLDEAFSKMDKERSEVCLRYARELELQLIVCVPDERLQSLIRNVDCVYGFRRHKNQISMMHIDKGDYLRMVEGEPDGEEERDGDAGEAVDPEDGYGGLPGGETDGLEASGDHAGNH